MLLKRKEKTKKKCPRCKSICHISEKTCPDCGLKFEKLELASNKLAKQNIFAQNKDAVISVPYFPKDVNKTKTNILVVLLGFFGVHNFYLGRYKKAIFQLLIGILTVLMVGVIYYTNYYYQILSYAGPVIGIAGVLWFVDMIQIIFNKYQIPISIATKEYYIDIEKKKLEKVQQKEVYKEYKKLKKEEKLKSKNIKQKNKD